MQEGFLLFTESAFWRFRNIALLQRLYVVSELHFTLGLNSKLQSEAWLLPFVSIYCILIYLRLSFLARKTRLRDVLWIINYAFKMYLKISSRNIYCQGPLFLTEMYLLIGAPIYGIERQNYMKNIEVYWIHISTTDHFQVNHHFQVNKATICIIHLTWSLDHFLDN